MVHFSRTGRANRNLPSFFATAARCGVSPLFRHVGLLESYFRGDVDVDGSLALCVRAALDMGVNGGSPKGLLRLRNAWHELRFSNRSTSQAKANARFHYALGSEFYRLWLDLPSMMYTCGYWKEGTRTVEEAQRNKLDHVARKIRLAPGERFVDIGCGFGGFMFHALDHYGAFGTGINITTEQVDWLRQEIARRGQAEKLQVIEADFREFPGQYDKVVSIGVLEHAGRDQLLEVVRAHADALKPGGLGMLHFIGHVGVSGTEFYIRKHIFPGGWIPSLSQTLSAMEACGLEIVDVENLRRHYALTLDEWAARFDARWDRDSASTRALRRGLPAQMAHVSVVLCRTVPLAAKSHPSVPDRVQQGQYRHAKTIR